MSVLLPAGAQRGRSVPGALHRVWLGAATASVYFGKIRVFKAGENSRLNRVAWNNGIGPRVLGSLVEG